MYSIYDYAYNGLLYLNNIMRPRHKRLSQLMIYSTTACQSRCKHCNIWKKRVEHLSLEDIRRIMQSKCVTKRTTVGLEGGEFILHPQAEEIMAWFQEHHPNYTLLSNCLAPRRVIDAVRSYQPRHLYVSLDGGRETYQRMRGRDGYDRVIQVVETLKNEVPLSLMFCLSPWNNFDDMAFVIDIAKQYGVDVRIGIYGTMAYMVAPPPTPPAEGRGVNTNKASFPRADFSLPSPPREGMGGDFFLKTSTSSHSTTSGATGICGCAARAS